MASKVTVDEVNALVAAAYPGSSNIRCIDVGERHAVAEMRPSPDTLRPGGIISGPTVFGLCDGVLWYAVFGAVGPELMAMTSELSIRYLRPAKGATITARADLHTVGRRNVVGSVVVWTDNPDKPVAVAQGTYVRPAEGSS